MAPPPPRARSYPRCIRFTRFIRFIRFIRWRPQLSPLADTNFGLLAYGLNLCWLGLALAPALFYAAWAGIAWMSGAHTLNESVGVVYAHYASLSVEPLGFVTPEWLSAAYVIRLFSDPIAVALAAAHTLVSLFGMDADTSVPGAAAATHQPRTSHASATSYM